MLRPGNVHKTFTPYNTHSSFALQSFRAAILRLQHVVTGNISTTITYLQLSTQNELKSCDNIYLATGIVLTPPCHDTSGNCDVANLQGRHSCRGSPPPVSRIQAQRGNQLLDMSIRVRCIIILVSHIQVQKAIASLTTLPHSVSLPIPTRRTRASFSLSRSWCTSFCFAPGHVSRLSNPDAFRRTRIEGLVRGGEKTQEVSPWADSDKRQHDTAGFGNGGSRLCTRCSTAACCGICRYLFLGAYPASIIGLL